MQDLAVVVLLMLIPLLAPSDSGALGLGKIAKALGVAALKAVVAIVTIIAGGRTLLRPFYRRIAAMENNEIFAATTLLVVLGTSVMTQIAGLSLALGAFLVSLCQAPASVCHSCIALCLCANLAVMLCVNAMHWVCVVMLCIVQNSKHHS